jgi:hypothetical protein
MGVVMSRMYGRISTIWAEAEAKKAWEDWVESKQPAPEPRNSLVVAIIVAAVVGLLTFAIARGVLGMIFQ